MIRKLIRLHFTTPVHIGFASAEYDHSDELLHSDTLYAAIIQAWQVLGVAHPVLQAEEHQVPDLGFSFSSLFPFYAAAEGNFSYYVPLPKGLLAPSTSEELNKRLKKVQWLDLPVFARLLRGEKLDYETQCILHYGDKFLSSTSTPVAPTERGFFHNHLITRSYVPRAFEEDTDTQIFYLDRMSFAPGSGLYGLIEAKDEAALATLLIGLRFLQDEGLGTDRYLGNGLFTLGFNPETQALDDWPAELSDLPPSNYSVNLSLFCPQDEAQLGAMLQGEAVSYQLTKRGGWINQYPHLSKRKNAVYMFKEGSILQHDARTTGKTVNLRPSILSKAPQDNVFRVGRSLFLPIKV